MALINLILFLLPFIFIDLSIFTHLYFLSFKNQFNINIKDITVDNNKRN